MKYFGTYDRSLDEKGRLQLPPKLLEKEGDNAFYLLKGFDGCMAIYNQEGFDRYLEKLEGLDFFDDKTRAFIRATTSSIVTLKFDSHGRLFFGKAVLEAYGIKKDVTIIGCLDHFEVWDPASYARYSLAGSFGFEQFASGVKRNA